MEKRGSIAFFATYRPPVALDLFSLPLTPNPASARDEARLTDGASYNYNGHAIPPGALEAILGRPRVASEVGPGPARIEWGTVFVSERAHGLETLHLGLRLGGDPKVRVFSFADVYGGFDGPRMEDRPCFAGEYIVYVSTKDPVGARRQPWTAVYRTHLRTGKTDRLTPKGEAHLSPAASPSGERIAVASFEVNGWNGEIEDLRTDIFVMNVDGRRRRRVIENGGWPTWGADNILFFHRKVGDNWAVFRADISKSPTEIRHVTPEGVDAVTPAAIDGKTVAVATVRQKSRFSDVRVEDQYRHIEVFDASGEASPKGITRATRPKTDHFNPFVIVDENGGKRIGYHRCQSELVKSEEENYIIERQSHKLLSPLQDVGMFRVSGVFPTFSTDGSQLAFVDNEFKAVWLADKKGLRIVYETEGADNVFAPVFNQNPEKDTLYICMGPSFQAKETVNLYALPSVSSGAQQAQQLTNGFNNAFPATNPEGTRLVFRSTRDGGDKRYKNLYIMEDAEEGEFGEVGTVTRLTNGPWVDSQCQWSPKGDWIVFSSTRDKPRGAPESDNGLDPGYYAVFLVKVSDPTVVVRVMASGPDVGGHVNHPCFSPDGRSIVVTADLAGVSADPMSLPLFVHSVRPYGDIFVVDIDPNDINKNKDVKGFTRLTHSRYEYSTAAWTVFSTDDPNVAWNMILDEPYYPACPYMHGDGAESFHLTGHLCIPRRCC